ncbi:MAG: phosphoenolpyruvate carboxykinase (ATP), partial [Oscillospiraceae bacterium]
MDTLGLEKYGFVNPRKIMRNLTPSHLVEEAIKRGEGELTDTGALLIKTGKYTGRSPKDKFIVDTPTIHDEIAWGSVNVPITQEKFNNIYKKMVAYLQNRDLFVFDGFAGADPKYSQAFRVINEDAAHNLFIHQLLIRPTEEQLKNFKEDYTIICAPGFKCIPEVDGVN